MLGNGVKRKLDEDEDGPEEDRGLLGVGIGVGGVSQASYTLRRQTVLNMSLMKLYGPRMGADLGLQRRVLINNVIRRIHDDFRQEGGVGALFFSVPSATPAVAAAAASEDESYRQPPPPSFGVLSSPLTALDSGLTPASHLEEDPPLFFTLPPSPPHPLLHSPRPPPPPSPKDSFSSALEEIEELCPSSSSSSSSPPPSPPPPPARVLYADVIMKEEARGLQEAESRVEKPPLSPPPPPPGTTDTSSSPPGAFLTDFALDDILFTDIDTSMYDFGPCPAPPGVAASKMVPVVMADDLVRSMSGYSAAGGGGQNQSFKMDLAELDHIMEVLVGS
ncbi:SERTA domain-containing protein 2-like [Diretmus argenteus]